MSEVKVKNQFLNEKNKRIRKSYIKGIKSQMDEYYETNSLQARNLRRRRNNSGEPEKISEVN